MSFVSFVLAALLVVPGSASALPFVAVNSKGETLRVAPHGDGYAVSLELPGLLPSS